MQHDFQQGGVALYLTFKETAATWLGVWSTICLALVVLTRTLGSHEAGKRVQVGAVLVSMVSFTLWVYGTDGYFLSVELPEPRATPKSGH